MASLKTAGEDFLAELLAKFTENWSGDRERLANAVDVGDAEDARKAAHRLKSSSANLGARRLSQRCHQAEQAARADDLSSIAPLLATLDAQYDLAVAALNEQQQSQTAA